MCGQVLCVCGVCCCGRTSVILRATAAVMADVASSLPHVHWPANVSVELVVLQSHRGTHMAGRVSEECTSCEGYRGGRPTDRSKHISTESGRGFPHFCMAEYVGKGCG